LQLGFLLKTVSNAFNCLPETPKFAFKSVCIQKSDKKKHTDPKKEKIELFRMHGHHACTPQSVYVFSRSDSGAEEALSHQALFPETAARPELFAHVPPPLSAAPMHTQPLPAERFNALWTALDRNLVSRDWLLRLIAVARTCVWLTPAQCCAIVDDLVAQHGWEAASEAGRQVRFAQDHNAYIPCMILNDFIHSFPSPEVQRPYMQEQCVVIYLQVLSRAPSFWKLLLPSHANAHMHRILPSALTAAGVLPAFFTVGNHTNTYVLDMRRHYDRGIALLLLDWNRVARKRLQVHEHVPSSLFLFLHTSIHTHAHKHKHTASCFAHLMCGCLTYLCSENPFIV
jgi:hypothetical protein